LTAQYRIVQARWDRRAAMTTWITALINRDKDHQPEPSSLEEVTSWLGHGFQIPPAEPPRTAEDMTNTAAMLNDLYGGVRLNGRDHA
jgi:hypothetical protein